MSYEEIIKKLKNILSEFRNIQERNHHKLCEKSYLLSLERGFCEGQYEAYKMAGNIIQSLINDCEEVEV